MEAIYLPSITGQFGNWRYYQVIFSVKYLTEIIGYKKDKTPIYRVKTVDEVDEIYSSSINEMLQRTFDHSRLEPIKNYLLKQNDKYINNITIAIFGGEPEWLPISLKSNSLEIYDEERNETLSKAFGVIKLTGNEVLFVLDGQHRIKGLREGLSENELLESEEIAITLVSHNTTPEGKEKTRRLFTTVNRYAKPVSLGETILLDEDDLSAIIARRIIEEHPNFIGKKIIALNKTADLKMPKDADKFSSVISLYTINEMLIDAKEVYPKYSGPKTNLVRIRPNDEILENKTTIIFDFWNSFFECFPNAQNFVTNVNENARVGVGAFSLRPIGQAIFCEYFLKMKNLGRLNEINLIQRIPDDLGNEFWHYVLYNPIGGTIINNRSYARDYLFYHLNLPLTQGQQNKLQANYRKYCQNENIQLPQKLILQ